MRSTHATLLAPLLAALLLSLAAERGLADTIVKRSGERLAGVTIESEAVTGVVYRQGRAAPVTLPVDQVARIEYERRPRLIQEAEVQMAEGDRSGAFATLQLYLEGQIETGGDQRRFPWAAPYAARRAMELAQALQASQEMVQMADRIIRHFGESRHAPFAYLVKAEGEVALGQREQAVRTLDQLANLVESHSLSASWTLEVRLAKAMANEALSGQARLTELEALIAAAGNEHSGVRLRAEVARGETYLQLALADTGRRAEFLRRAGEAFRSVESAEGADDRTRAGALSGLGDSLFLGADPAVDKDDLVRARDYYLRVAVLFPNQTGYAARALFHAARCFDLAGDDADRLHAQRLYREVQRRFPGTRWADEARTYRR